MLSIIVPVYNTQKYIRKCLGSILNQTYTDFELILIDDGSTDGCGKICNDYAQLDNRIVVFHTLNRGLSAARNYGISKAKGDYIGFVDSDDWIEPDMYEVLLKNIGDDEICICGFWYEYMDYSHVFSFDHKEYDSEESLAALIKGKLSNPVWNKIYKKSTFRNVLFPEGKNYEDISTMHHILGNANKVKTVRDVKYHYRQRSEGISQTHSAKNLFDYCDACFNRYYYIKENYSAIYNADTVEILRIPMLGVARIWCYYYGFAVEEKMIYSKDIRKLSCFTRTTIPKFGIKGWPAYLNLLVVFIHNNKLCFFLLYMINMIYRKLKQVFRWR